MPQLNLRFSFFLLLLVIGAQAMVAQSVRISQGGRVNICEGMFLDSGGAGGNHNGPAAGTQTMTLCSDDGTDTHLTVGFQAVDVDGTLTVFDGSDATAPVLVVIDGASPENVNAIATLANTSGCLTFIFESTGVATGWAGVISCNQACQPIEAEVVSTSPAPMPDLAGYIDICPGDEVTFNARGLYSQNNVGYAQSDATSIFTWNFQDGDPVTGVGLSSVSHVFDKSGGYIVQLTITDERGCTNLNRISQRVRVAPPPNFSQVRNLPNTLCVGEEVNMTVGRVGGQFDVDFDPEPVEFGFVTSQVRSDTIPLPDVLGVIYSSPIIFDNFAPGAVVGSADDIVEVCTTMEHAWLGDIDIFVTCPSGEDTLWLHRFLETGARVSGQRLGDADRTTTGFDPPGRYCWRIDAPRTMSEHVDQLSLVTGDIMPEIAYAYDTDATGGGFGNIIGCPLNGTWALNFEDHQDLDSGWSFNWSITFRGTLFPEQETFLVPVTDYRFEDFENFTFYGGDTSTFVATDPGPNTIKVVSTDDYGCVYDTAVTIDVLPFYAAGCAAGCGPLVDRNSLDTATCAGDSFRPNIAVNISEDTLVRFTSFASENFGRSFYPDEDNAFLNNIRISDFEPGTITNVAVQLGAICVSLENDGELADVTIEVIAPNGRVLTLVDNFGGAGEDLTQTCFSPTASDAIGTGTAPYTGTFRPSNGNWTSFNGTNINGTWQLRAWDDAGNDVGSLVSWSISLNYDRGNTYAWTPVDGNLSCTDCPNPVITATSTTTYTLNVTNDQGCTDQSVVNITLNTLDITVAEDLTDPRCAATNTGGIDITVSGTEPSYTYRWSNNVTTEDLLNVPAGNYTVTITDPNGCLDEFEYVLNDPPVLSLTPEEVIDVDCFGGSTGEIRVTTSGGTEPYTYAWDDLNAQNNEDAGALTAGTYTLRVTDFQGCTTTLTETVGEPARLTIAFRDGAVTCRDGNDGYAVALPGGGTAPYTYAWQTGATTDSVPDLNAGTFEVTVTDQRGCMATNTVTVNQPVAPLTAMIAQDLMGCFGTSANSATVTPSGGTGPYTFLWSNGETTPTAASLPAGSLTVDVSDANGCTETFTGNTVDLEEIVVTLQLRLPTCNDRTDGGVGAAFNVRPGTAESQYTYLWSNGMTGPAINGVTGNATYSVTVTGPRGCEGIGERFLPAPPPILFNVDQESVNCAGDNTGSLTLTNINGPNGGPYDIQWGPEAGSNTTTVVRNLIAGGYSLRISDAVGCVVDTVIMVTEPPVLGGLISQTDVSCFGETDGRISVAGTGGVGGFRYAWSTGSNQNQIAGLAAGTYRLTITDANDCEDIQTIEIIQPDRIGISVVPMAAICEGDATGTITVTGSGGRPPYLFGLEGQGFTRNETFIGLRAGEYQAFVRDSSGCQTNTMTTVADGPTFTLELPGDTTIIFGDSIDLEPIIVGGVDTLRYTWVGSYGGTLTCTDCREPNAMPEYEIDYTLTITDGTSCRATDRMRVSVRKVREVAVPTGFTPNGDGQNDVLIVHGRPGTRVVSFAVFDRWANVLYEASDYEVNDASMGWDGTANDQDVNGGVYFYKIVVRYDDDSEEVLSGQTTLIK